MKKQTPRRRHVLLTLVATLLTTVSATAPIGANLDHEAGRQRVTPANFWARRPPRAALLT